VPYSVAQPTPTASATSCIVCSPPASISRAIRSLSLVTTLGRPPQPPAGARRLQPRPGPLPDQVLLSSDSAMATRRCETPAARQGRCVDPLGQAAKTELALLELTDQLDQMPQRAAQAIQTPDHQHGLPIVQLLKRPGQLRAVLQRPGRGAAKAKAPLAVGPL